MSAHAARPPRACSRWRPAALVTTDVVAIKLWLGVAALVRAADYAHSGSSPWLSRTRSGRWRSPRSAQP